MLLTVPSRVEARTGRGWCGRRSLVVGLAAALSSLVGAALASPITIIGPWVAAIGLLHWRLGAGHHEERQQLLADLPPFVDALIQRLKAGGSLSQALAETRGSEPLELRLGPFRLALLAGLGLDVALERLRTELAASSPQLPSLHLLLNTLAVLVERGGPALGSLERLNDTLRSAQWIDSEVRTQAGQATASALVLAALPVLFVVGLTALDGRLARFYLFDVVGAVCLVVTAILSYVGWWWMNRIVRGGR